MLANAVSRLTAFFTPTARLLQMDVELGDGKSGTVVVREGDLPSELAAAFVARHGLDECALAPLQEAVAAQIEQMRAEQPGAKRPRA